MFFYIFFGADFSCPALRPRLGPVCIKPSCYKTRQWCIAYSALAPLQEWLVNYWFPQGCDASTQHNSKAVVAVLCRHREYYWKRRHPQNRMYNVS